VAVRLVGNKLTDEDIALLKLVEKKNQLHDYIKKGDLDQEQKQKLFAEYKEVRKRIKDKAYTPAGIFDDTKFGHLRKGGSINLELLKEWRMRKVEKMTTEELVVELKSILNEKEFKAFVKSNIEEKHYKEVAAELDISDSYSCTLKKNAESKIKKKYDVDKVIEKLEDANFSIDEEAPDEEETEDVDQQEKELSQEDNKAIHDAVGKIFTDANDSETEEEPEEQSNDENKPKGVFVAFDDDLETDDVEQISQLITRIQGVSHISNNSHEVEEIKEELVSILNRF